MRGNLGQSASFETNIMVLFPASLDDVVTLDYLFRNWLKDLLFIINMNPEVDFQLSLLPTKSKRRFFLTHSFFVLDK